MRFQPLDKLINLHDGYTQSFKVDDLHLLLIQRNGERYLIEARCPHREHPLDVASIDDGVITCALHQYRFAIASGELIQATEEPCRGLHTYPLVYEGNAVGILL
jgi:nitrite reductase/ring-hydroxylating ferredoxin subunit